MVAEVDFFIDSVTFKLRRRVDRAGPGRPPADACLSCHGIDWQLPSMTQVLTQFSAMLSTVVNLGLTVRLERDRLDGTSDVEWLHFLKQFSTVRALFISGWFAGQVALAIENMSGEMVAEALSSLDLISLELQPLATSSFEKFVTVRRLSGLPVTVICAEA